MQVVAPGLDVVTIEGRQLPDALGTPVERLGLFAVQQGRWAPIPFQVDERDAHGRLALPQGPEPTTDETPGILDANDLLVFAVSDLGQRIPAPAATAIRVRDPNGQHDGWVYLQRFPGPAPRSPRDYVDYDPVADAVYATHYSVRFNRSVPSYFAFANGKHHEGPNLLHRLEVRVSARILWGLVVFHRTEADVHQRVIAYKDGPVRVLRRTRMRVDVGFGLTSPSVTSEDAFTADTVEGPSVVQVPFSLRYLFADLDVRLFLNFRDLRDFELLYGTAGRRTVRCEERVSGALPVTKGLSWFALRGRDGTLLYQLRLGHGLESVTHRLWYAAASSSGPPPASQMCPAVGYELTHWGRVERGTYTVELVMRALPPMPARGVRDYVAQWHEHGAAAAKVNPAL